MPLTRFVRTSDPALPPLIQPPASGINPAGRRQITGEDRIEARRKPRFELPSQMHAL
jgi:hypothetical protein